MFVHLFTNLHAPFGDAEGEPDIERDGHDDYAQIAHIEDDVENQTDHGQFKDQRADGKQHETQQKFDSFNTAFNDAGQAAGFAGDVIA